MSWGTLKTWITNELVTAATMNEQLRDKFAELWKYQQKGDLMVAAGPSDLVRLALGANGQALIADSAAAAGMRWGQAAPVAAYIEKQPANAWSTNAATYAELFGANQCSVTLNLGATSTLYCWASGVFRPTAIYQGAAVKVRLDAATDSMLSAQKSCQNSSYDVSWVPWSLTWRKTGVAAGAHTLRLIGAQVTGPDYGAAEFMNASLLVFAYAE